jgi:hypothetical protein
LRPSTRQRAGQGQLPFPFADLCVEAAAAIVPRAFRDAARDLVMIRHAALFRLVHAPQSPEEADFLAALARLSEIPGVGSFRVDREISPNNPYAFAVSMVFADAAAYRAYDADPRHVAFVQGRWVPEVAEFMEHDTAPL